MNSENESVGTSHFGKRSSQMMLPQVTREEDDLVSVQQAGARKRSWGYVAAKLADSIVLGIALLPVPLVAVSIVLVFMPETSEIIDIFAGLFILWVAGFLVHQFRLFDFPFNISRRSPKPSSKQSESVIVIGAGPVGLAMVKECLAEDLNVKCFERQDGVGGVFHFNRKFPGGCWPTVRLTSSPWVTAYSDFAPETASSKHYTAQEYVDYLERYVDYFRLRKHLYFGKTVTKVKPITGGGWTVKVLDQETQHVERYRCDRVAVCAGLNLQPRAVNLSGADSFTGRIMHSAYYTGPEGLVDKRVTVVGAGESGVDIATEVSKIAAQTDLSIRGGKFVIPRINPLTGVANDYDTNRIRNAPPIALQNWFMRFKRRLCRYADSHTPESAFRNWLLEQSHVGPMSQIATKSDDFIHQVIDKKLILRKMLVRLDKDTLIFEDGAQTIADVIIFAHAYVPSFPFIHYPDGVRPRHPGEMYLQMFHPELGNSIVFGGFARPSIGAIPPTGELQARLFAQVASGKCARPNREMMLKDIERTQLENASSFPTQPQPNAVVRWIPYMDKLADMLGCRPHLLQLLTRPGLLWKVCSGPMTAANYRLCGPGASHRALATVIELSRTHPLNEILANIGLHFWLWPIQLLHPNPTWRASNTIL